MKYCISNKYTYVVCFQKPEEQKMETTYSGNRTRIARSLVPYCTDRATGIILHGELFEFRVPNLDVRIFMITNVGC